MNEGIDIMLRADYRCAMALRRLHQRIDERCAQEKARDAMRRAGVAVVTVTASMDKFLASMARARVSVEALRDAMIDRMLTGEWS